MVWLDMIAERLFGNIQITSPPAWPSAANQLVHLSRQQWLEYRVIASGPQVYINGVSDGPRTYIDVNINTRSVGCKNCGATIQPSEHACSYCKSPR